MRIKNKVTYIKLDMNDNWENHKKDNDLNNKISAKHILKTSHGLILKPELVSSCFVKLILCTKLT